MPFFCLACAPRAGHLSGFSGMVFRIMGLAHSVAKAPSITYWSLVPIAGRFDSNYSGDVAI
jgi:hypothetical protein